VFMNETRQNVCEEPSWAFTRGDRTRKNDRLVEQKTVPWSGRAVVIGVMRDWRRQPRWLGATCHAGFVNSPAIFKLRRQARGAKVSKQCHPRTVRVCCWIREPRGGAEPG